MGWFVFKFRIVWVFFGLWDLLGFLDFLWWEWVLVFILLDNFFVFMGFFVDF